MAVDSGSSKRAAQPDAAHEPTIPSSILSHYRLFARAMGLDPEAMLAEFDIPVGALSDPSLKIPVSRGSALIERSAAVARAPDFGLRLALVRGAPDIGPISLLLREEPDLGSALRSLTSYMPIHSRGVRFELREEGDLAILATHFADNGPAFPVVQSTEMMVCSVMNTIKQLIGADWRPAGVGFAHDAASDPRHYRALLGCPVDFGQDFDGIVFTPEDLRRPIARSSPQLRQHAETYVQSLLDASPADFEAQISHLIVELLPTGDCSVTAIAQKLGIDRSTLGRRLAGQGQSYAGLLQQCRVRIASRSCLSRRPLAEVADQLGFSSLSVFSRWFARSFGVPATAWRRAELAGVAS